MRATPTLTLTVLLLTTALAVKKQSFSSALSAASREAQAYASCIAKEAEKQYYGDTDEWLQHRLADIEDQTERNREKRVSNLEITKEQGLLKAEITRRNTIAKKLEESYRRESDAWLAYTLEGAENQEKENRNIKVSDLNVSRAIGLLKAEIARRKIYQDQREGEERYGGETDEWLEYTLQEAKRKKEGNAMRNIDNDGDDKYIILLTAEIARRDKKKEDRTISGGANAYHGLQPAGDMVPHGSHFNGPSIVTALYKKRSDIELMSLSNSLRKKIDAFKYRPSTGRKRALKRELNEIQMELRRRGQERYVASRSSVRNRGRVEKNTHSYQQQQQQQPYQPSYQPPYELIPPHFQNHASGQYPYSTYSPHALIYSQPYAPLSIQQRYQHPYTGYVYTSNAPDTAHDQSRDSRWDNQPEHRQYR